MSDKPDKPKRPKKRFTTKEQIVERIDKFTAKAKRQRDQQKVCYLKASELRRTYQGRPGYHGELSKANKLDIDGDKLGRKADRLEKDVLRVLRLKLAEFMTEPIPGLLSDRSVEEP